MDKSVSVVIPTHNMEKHIAAAVTSALEQTYPITEVVVVDDGSTDGTPQVMKQFEEDERVKYFRRSRMGQGRARNLTLQLAESDFVAFLDADDLWDREKLEKQIPLFDGDPNIGVVYSDAVVMAENGEVVSRPEIRRYSGNITRRLFEGNFIPMSSAVGRKRCLDSVGGFSESLNMGLDYDLWLRVSAVCTFVYVPEPLMMWRRWEGQTCSNNFKGRHESDLTIRKRFVEQFPRIVPEKLIRRTEAMSYLQRGINYFHLERNRVAAAMDFLTALRRQPGLTGAWKGLVKCILPTAQRGS